jgi:hypothetical protein
MTEDKRPRFILSKMPLVGDMKEPLRLDMKPVVVEPYYTSDYAVAIDKDGIRYLGARKK